MNKFSYYMFLHFMVAIMKASLLMALIECENT